MPMPRHRRIPAALAAACLIAAAAPVAAQTNATFAPPERLAHGYRYRHDEVRAVPWSIHVLELDRSRRDFEFANTLGAGTAIGLSTVSDQLKALSLPGAVPIAAVNGDFYNTDGNYPGDPRDFQVRDGELVSAPKGHACFWIDPDGRPRGTNVVSRFAVSWPDGSSAPFGLNEARDANEVVLFSAANGKSTRTSGGTELILEAVPGKPWLPLRPCEEIEARVREVRAAGDTSIAPGTLVLSLGPSVAPKPPQARAGDVLRLSTETFPGTRGVRMAIGGGPTLVHASRPMSWANSTARHPRTAIGWNRDRFFLVEVDGRQSGLSVGMSFPELADYMRKLGCDEAINLDGGGSATLWVAGQVMNSPSEGHERPGANALVIVQRKPEPAPHAPAPAPAP